jgi:hypothetical protein
MDRTGTNGIKCKSYLQYKDQKLGLPQDGLSTSGLTPSLAVGTD